MVTIILIVVTAAISWLAFERPAVVQRLILWPPAIERNKQFDRLLTHGFIHADFSHLLFNMITLFFFGRAMEWLYARHLGPLGFLWFYLGGLLVSILPTYIQNRRNANYRSLGASGAVSAVLFAFILLSPWSMIFVFFFPVPAILYAVAFVAFSIWMDHRGGGSVNHSAHMWGAAYGIVFTVLMEPRVISVFLQQLRNPHFGM
jgi:membrane associated rhomboid family serine protease